MPVLRSMSGSVDLQFMPDELTIRAFQDFDFAAESLEMRAALVGVSSLEFPVRFVAGGVDMFPPRPQVEQVMLVDLGGSVTRASPTTYMAPRRMAVVGLMESFDRAMSDVMGWRRRARVYVPEGGDIKLQRRGDVVTIISETRDRAVVPLDDLMMAVTQFKSSIIRLFEDHFANFKAYPEFARWFERPTD
jgi:hypothetical protein